MAKKASIFAPSAAYSSRLQSWKRDDIPAPRSGDVLSLLAGFLKQIGYTQTSTALVSEAKTKQIILDLPAFAKSAGDNLFDILALYRGHTKSWPTLVTVDKEEVESSSASDDEEDDDMIDDEAEETSDDSSDEDSVDETANVKAVDKKRKRAVTPESSEASDPSDDSSSASSSDSESSADDAPPAKKSKRDSTSSSAASSSSSSSDSDPSSSSSESSSSDSDSSSSSSGSSSSEDAKPKYTKPAKKAKGKKEADVESSVSSSATSTTLSAPPSPTKKTKKNVAKIEAAATPVAESGMHPDRLARIPGGSAVASPAGQNTPKLKKGNVPFSRIPADTKVDPRFSSNAYVSYDYADRAHQDLIVTKGKGFTKEKNKKKRGSYRGGTIDLTPKGIKFDD